MNTERIGRFKISKESLKDWRNLQHIFASVVVVEAKFRWDTQNVEYVAYSDLFEEVPECTVAPFYIFTFERTLHGDILTKCERSANEHDAI